MLQYFLSRFKSTGLVGPGEETQNRFAVLEFQSEWYKLLLIYVTSCPDASYQVSSQMAFLFRSISAKFIFKMAAILDFWSKEFSYFDLQVATYFLPKFRVNWPLGLGETAQNISQDSGHLGFSIYVWSTVPQYMYLLVTKFQVNWPFS